ncbi:hypothetical protein [Bacillus sp. 2205SS5-2]|uniref:hypothetical protein n=1 Tax=Bacillus sp. 2205SS5-2 TaxID=3109031 RepID=UPI0030070F25
MKNSEVMPASLEGYSFDPEPQATVARSGKAEVARPAAAGKCYPTEKVLTFGVGCYLSHSC